MAIAGATAAGATITGAVLSNKANTNAANLTAQSNQATLEYQKAADAEKKREFDQQQTQLQALNDTNQKNYAATFAASEEERLRARAISNAQNSRRNAGLVKLGSLLGTDLSGSLLPTGDALGPGVAQTLPTTVNPAPGPVLPGAPAPAVPPGASPAPAGAATGATGDAAAQAAFSSLVQGLPPTAQSLATIEGPLTQKGIKVLRGPNGISGQVQLPSGRVVTVFGAPSGSPTSSPSPAGIRPFSSLMAPGGL